MAWYQEREGIGIIGSAVVGQALARGFQSKRYEVRIGSRTPAKLDEFAAPNPPQNPLSSWAWRSKQLRRRRRPQSLRIALHGVW